jgi:hypothetical protein
MTKPEQLIALARASFPTTPLPDRFFWTAAKEPLDPDEDLLKRVAGRLWDEVTILDWRMIGCPPAVSKGYLEPATFLYYLPSFLIGVFDEPDFLDYALESLIPHNQWHVPGGAWWDSFFGAATPEQKRTILFFLEIVPDEFRAWFDETNQYYHAIAQSLWSQE